MKTELRSCQKENLVLIHGWGLGPQVWTPLLPKLSQNFVIHIVVLPGYSLTFNDLPIKAHAIDLNEHVSPSDQHSFESIVNTCLSQLPNNSFICGWSLGSLIAMAIALTDIEQNPQQKCRALCLVSATPCFTQKEDWQEAQSSNLLQQFAKQIQQNASTTLSRFISMINQGDSNAKTIIQQLRHSALNQLPAEPSLLSGLHWLNDTDLRNSVSKITQPCLIFHGRNDPLMPATAAKALAKWLPNSQLTIQENCAHTPFSHDADAFCTALIQFCTPCNAHE